MIKITDGINTRVVTVGMYNSLYINMGYKPVEQKIEPKQVEKPVEKPIKKDEEVKVFKKENNASKK